jgi:hypothetical protein
MDAQNKQPEELRVKKSILEQAPQPVSASFVIKTVDYINSLPPEDRDFYAAMFYMCRGIPGLSMNRRFALCARMEALAEIMQREVLIDYVERLPSKENEGWLIPEDILRSVATAPMAKTLNEMQQERWHFEPEAFIAHLRSNGKHETA